MTTRPAHSAIAEVRDELSLDFADQAYLDVVSANLGLTRPVFGFRDKIWRAITKEIALDYKQIRTKFRALLTILVGPQKTLVTSFSEAIPAGTQRFYVHRTDHIPQVGTMVLDEGLPTEETIPFVLTDKYSNLVYLERPTAFAHAGWSSDAESVLAVDAQAGATQLILFSTDLFPTSGYPYTLVVDRGTPAEEVVTVLNNDVYDGVLTVTPTVRSHQAPQPSLVRAEFSPTFSYVMNMGGSVLQLSFTADADNFPTSGALLLGPSSSTYNVLSSTSNTVTVPGTPFSLNRQIRHRVRFSDTTPTTALRSKEFQVIANSQDEIFIEGTFPASPALGDVFSIRPVVEFISTDYSSAQITLARDIADLDIASSTTVELLSPGTSLVAFGPVQLKGTGWDVIQTDPNHVEVLLPVGLDPSDLRSASYLHTAGVVPTPSTATTAPLAPGALLVSVASTAGLPFIGAITLDVGGVNEESLMYRVVDATTLELVNGTVSNVHIAGTSVELLQPSHPSDPEVLSGNVWTDYGAFPGPYVYDLQRFAPNLTQLGPTPTPTRLATMLAAPSRVAMSQTVGNTALEVVDASHFPLTGYPYLVRVGDRTGNREDIFVNRVSLRSRATAIQLTSSATAGVTTTLSVSTLDPGGAGVPGGLWPVAEGFRVLIAPGTGSQEAVYVTAVDPMGPTFTLDTPVQFSHSIGAVVTLMADVLTTDPTEDSHVGIVQSSQRHQALPRYGTPEVSGSETIGPLYAQVPLVSTTGFVPSGAKCLLNFGNGVQPVRAALTAQASAGDTTFTVATSTTLPTVFPYIVVLSPGTSIEERVRVSSYNPFSGVAFITDGAHAYVQNTHPMGSSVLFESSSYEDFDYASVSGNSLILNEPQLFVSNHYPSDTAIPSIQRSLPRLNGYDFPLRMPADAEFRLRSVFDLVRAAGILVTFIDRL